MTLAEAAAVSDAAQGSEARLTALARDGAFHVLTEPGELLGLVV